jgi:xanthine dehydrogenase accessory factor
MNWVNRLLELQQQAIPAVMVTVASTVGSTPREPGAKMIVTRETMYGTIGGGNLEHKACMIARSQLDTEQPNQLQRFPLGAGLGQCCGGLVNLMFEPIVESTPWLEMAKQFHSSGEDWVRLVSAHQSADQPDSDYLILAEGQIQNKLSARVAQADLLQAAQSLLLGENNVGLFQSQVDQYTYFIEATRKTDFQLVLFGAGHVGRAIVKIMQELPISIRWIDTRDDQLVSGVPAAGTPADVEFICTDTPEAEVDAAPANCFFLVMTHDHALDQQLTEQILKRDDFAYFGLIGSASKRRLFETRMSRRGFEASQFARLTCPIGIDGIQSKQPAAIAISVAAELMQVYDQSVSNINNNPEVRRSLGRTR